MQDKSPFAHKRCGLSNDDVNNTTSELRGGSETKPNQTKPNDRETLADSIYIISTGRTASETPLEKCTAPIMLQEVAHRTVRTTQYLEPLHLCLCLYPYLFPSCYCCDTS